MSGFEIKFNTAKEHQKNQNFFDAIELLNEIIIAKPLFAPAYSLMADIFQQTGYKQKALDLYMKCIEIVPSDAVGYVGASKILYELRRYSGALQICQKFKPKKGKDNLEILLSSVRAFIGLNNHEKAKQVLKNISKMDKENNHANVYMAEILVKEGNYRKAVDLCDDVLRKDSRFYLAYAVKAKVLWELGKEPLALDAYRKALVFNPNDIDVIINTAKILSVLGKDNECFDKLKLAVKISENCPDIIAFAAFFIYNKGYCREALEMLRATVDNNPENTKLNIALGVLLIEEGDGDLKNSCQYFEKAIANDNLEEDDFITLHNQFLSISKNDNDGCIKDLIDFWICTNPFEPLVVNLKKIIYQEKINDCELGYLKRIYNSRALLAYEKAPEITNANDVIIDALSKTIFAKKNDATVLDAGAGFGSLAEILHSVAISGDLYGVDFSSNMIDLCRKKNVYNSLSTVEISKFLDNIYEHFDLIVADGIFQTKGDLLLILQTFIKSLVLGGFLFFTVKVNDDVNDDFKIDKDGLFCHSIDYVKTMLKKFAVDVVMDRGFAYKNFYGSVVNARCFVVKKTFL